MMCPKLNSCFFPGRLVYLLLLYQDKKGIKSGKNDIKIFEEYDQKLTDLLPHH